MPSPFLPKPGTKPASPEPCVESALSEIWECLANEPDQAAAAAELADFCQMAIKHLVRDQRAGGGDQGICDKIIGESDGR